MSHRDEIPKTHTIIWDNQPLFSSVTKVSLAEYSDPQNNFDQEVIHQVVCPSLKPELVLWGEIGLRVIGQRLYFKKEIHQSISRDGLETVSSPDFRGMYKFSNKRAPIAVTCSSYIPKDQLSNPNLPDRLSVHYKHAGQLITFEYHPHSGKLQAITFDLPSEKPRHPVFGPQMEIDIDSYRAHYKHHGGLTNRTDMHGRKLSIPPSPEVTYSILHKGNVIHLALLIGTTRKRISSPLSLQFNTVDIVQQLTDPQSDFWIDTNFLSLLQLISAQKNV
jgi:hypothetical protein